MPPSQLYPLDCSYLTPNYIEFPPKVVPNPLYVPKLPFLAILASFWGYMSKMCVYDTIIRLKIQKIMTRARARIMRVRAYTRVRRYLGEFREYEQVLGV